MTVGTGVPPVPQVMHAFRKCSQFLILPGLGAEKKLKKEQKEEAEKHMRLQQELVSTALRQAAVALEPAIM